MGIYIKLLKAPASCCKCRFSRWSNYGQCYMCNVCEKPITKLSSEYESTKPDWCPLVEIPEPHGRLIDADALEPDILPDWDGVHVPDDGYSLKCVRNAPTIIEAEGSEDNVDT